MNFDVSVTWAHMVLRDEYNGGSDKVLVNTLKFLKTHKVRYTEMCLAFEGGKKQECHECFLILMVSTITYYVLHFTKDYICILLRLWLQLSEDRAASCCCCC